MKKIFKFLPLAMLVTGIFAACVQDDELVSFDFSATVEKLYDPAAPTEGSKVYLYNERWVYWEEDDVISIASDRSDGSQDYFALLAPQSMSDNHDFDGFNGIFVTALPAGSKYFLGLHPFSESNSIEPTGGSNFHAIVNLPNEQPYMSDMSFARDVLPMVAWYGGSWTADQPSTPFNLDFHSLAGLARFQFFNTSGQDVTIESIEFTERNDKPMAGNFHVLDYNTHNPRLSPVTGEFQTSINVTFPGGKLFRSNNSDDLITVYLVLPSTTGSTSGSDEYNLAVRFVYDDGNSSAEIPCTFSIKRSAITFMEALALTDAGLIPAIPGYGTPERPFRIYNLRHLQYVRDQFYSSTGGQVYINNQLVTDDTRFEIMRNDIKLLGSDWQYGIPGFRGKMTYVANPGTSLLHKGITNNSSSPLFESINENAVVEGIPMYADIQNTATGEDAFSPFCNENNGTIRDCRIITADQKVIVSSHKPLAGLCVENGATGRIERCESLATFQTSGNIVAGICNHNLGVISQCNTSSQMSATVLGADPKVGGICYENDGIIRDCFFATNILNSDDKWGGIAYLNDVDGQIMNCYFSHSATLRTSASAGGIVNQNAGLIDHCWFEGTLQAGVSGGIAAYLTDDTIRNCFISISPSVSPAAQVTLGMLNSSSTIAGGLVGQQSGGDLVNSYFYAYHIYTIGSSGQAGALVGRKTAGNINNCYAREEMPAYKVVGSLTGSPNVTNTYYVSDGGAVSYATLVATNAASTLAGNLNANVAGIPNALQWRVDDAGYVALENYLPSAKKKKR